ncbi:MAG: GntR family transcriptional regulator [Sciscionella sp.]|nr:GntR family transcriptional regulator [Sciscionella sp.]
MVIGPVRGGIPEHGRVPKSFAAKDELLVIVDGLAEGDPLPPERDLAERLGVSRATIRQAVREILLAGRVKRMGRNTVKAGPKLTQPLSLSSYTEGVRSQGRTPGRIVVQLTTIDADSSLADDLAVDVGAPVIHLERVLLVDDERVGLESTFLSQARFSLPHKDFDPTGSLYAWLEANGVRFASATERIETVLASPREAMLIGISPALPMLLLERRSVDADGRPIERVRGLYRGDRFSFTTTLVTKT